MQRLATENLLLACQMLTATHDESTAWSSLGSALLVLFKQTRLAASVVDVLFVTIDLIGIATLHILTLSLFNLQVFEQSNRTTIITQIGMPKITFNGLTSPCGWWPTVTTLLPYLSRADLNNIIGVQEGTLYDILSDNNGTGSVAVGAQAFNAMCGSVPNMNITVDGMTPTDQTNYNVSIQYDHLSFSFAVDM